MSVRSRTVAAAVTLALVTVGIGAVAAPAQAAAPCPPYSTLDCADLAVDLSGGFALDFTGTEGGVADRAGVGTGFTLVQPKASGDPYVPANIAVAGGALSLTTTAGIAFNTNNNQDNALGVALPASAAAGVFDLRTTLLAPPAGAGRAEQAGLWIGPNQDLYAKVELVSAGGGNVQVEIATESPGKVPPVDGVGAVKSAPFALGTTDVALRMRVDAAARTATGYYTLGTGAEVTVATVALAPALLDGSALTPAIPGAVNYAGVYATHRNRGNAPAQTPPTLTYSFGSFAVSEPVVPDTTPPAAPASLTATPALDTVGLTWPAVAEAGVAGYRVYRSATSPVALTGTPASGTALLTSTSWVDDTVFAGAPVHYAVVAVDEAGNASAGAAAGPAGVTGPGGTSVARVDFGPAAVAPAAGYLADTGAAFGDRGQGRQYGWLEQAALPARTPLDLSTNTRDRAGVADPRLKTIIHAQYDDIVPLPTTNGVTKKGYWEYAVPPGRYGVVVGVGDNSTNYDSVHLLRAEGTPVDADGFVPSAARQFDEAGVASVTVTDGFLTLDAVGGRNTKPAYVEITSLETFDVTAPATPGGLVAAAGDARVTLGWDPVADATEYRVWRSAGGAGPDASAAPYQVVAAPAAPGTVSTTDTAVANGTSYSYAVAAADAAGNVSPPSAPVTATPAAPADTEAPPAPTGLAAAVSGTAATLTWDAVAAADLASYTLVEVTGNGPGTVVRDGLTATTATVDGLTAGTTTRYAVRAVDTAGNTSGLSASVEVVVPAAEVCPAGAGWVGEYFAAPVLPAAGATPAAVRCDAAVGFDWGAGGPGLPGIGADGFSARWSDTVTVTAGTYRFTARGDDGIRVYVDGVRIIDEWRDQGADRQFTAEVPLTAGAHELRVEYYENAGGALVDVSYARVPDAVTCAAGQWQASYYANRTLSGAPARVDCVDAISRDWGLGGPEGVGVDDFSVRWSRTGAFAAGEYVLTATSDDGIRVRVDDQLVLDKFFDQGAGETYTVPLTLAAGQHSVVVDYYENGGGALARVGLSQLATPCADGWSAQYFGNKSLDGTPLATGCEAAVSHDWGAGGPAGVGVDGFSARWTRTATLAAGTYRFESRSDDGIRVFVDGAAVIDRFVDRGAGAPDVAEVPLTAGEHTIVVEYYENGGGALVQVDYTRVPDAVTCPATQWTAQYLRGRSLTGAVAASECVATIDEDWGLGGPEVDGARPVGTDDFSARWTRTSTFEAGTYRVSARADDGIRVRVDGALVLDEWRDQGADQEFTAEVPLTAGEHTVVVEYYENGAGALARAGITRVAAPDPAPAAPTGLAATAAAAAVDLAWSPVAEADLVGYLVFRATGPAGTTVDVTGTPLSGAAPLSTPAYTDTTAAPGTAYTYAVVAVDATGQRSGASAPATATVAPPAPVVDEAWNFQPAAAPVPAGFTADTGAAYTAAAGRGWVTQTTAGTASPTPLDLTRNTRDRNRAGIAQDLDTMIHAQYGDILPAGTNGVLTPGAWERVVPNGTYVVSVSVGDQQGAAGYDSRHVVRAEGQTVLPSFQATAAEEYRTGTATVVVADGRLSVDAIGGTNTKLNWIRIRTAAPDTTPPAAPARVDATAGDARVSLSWPAVADAVGYRVYRGTALPVATTGPGLAGADLLTATTFADTTAANGTAYRYAVVAVDAAGNASPAATSAAVIPAPLAGVTLKVDFGTETMTPAAGYLLDFGQAYGSRTGANQGTGRTYGWVEQDEGSAALSLVGNGRVRGRAGVDPRVDSFVHAQYADVDGGTNGVNVRGAWELAVPDGTYEVTVAVGDQEGSTGYDSTHAVNVEAAAALVAFTGAAAEEYRTVTTTVAVRDGRLTVSARGGVNTKIGYLEVTQVADRPRIVAVTPPNRTAGADVSAGVAADIAVPGLGVGVDASTLTTANVELFELATGAKVTGSSNTSGGNDTVNFAPAQPLKPFTAYRFVVGTGVRANDGTPFLPFQSVFTTGDDVITVPDTFTPITDVAFEKVDQPAAAGPYIASMVFGPDGKLYATTIGGGLKRWTVAADGTLSASEDLAPALLGRAVIGIVFDKASTAGDLRAWVTHATANLGGEATEWSSTVSMVSGPTLATRTDVFVGLPRSQKDHLSNSIIYGPGDDLYFLQGSNQAAGDPDSAWGTRGEKLLTAALLRFDPDHAAVRAALAGGPAVNVQTADTAAPYDPYAAGAPLTLYATGIRNAYDLVYHSNGHIYVPTNGTAGGGNSPGLDVTYGGGSLIGATHLAATGTPGAAGITGTSVLDACRARVAREPGLTLVDVPAVFNHNKQRDFLYDVVEGGYYGHPNPLRCEFTLNNGALPAGVGEGGTKYPAGVQPDPNYRGWSYDFQFNKSPNGVVEYRSTAFGGKLKGRLAVVRFSNNNDLEWIQVDSATGATLGAQTAQGITGVPGSAIGGIDGFLDPLEIVEDPRTGNLYVNQYDQGGSQQKLFLLRVPAAQAAQALTASVEELVFSSTKAATDGPLSVTVTNAGTQSVPLAPAISGTHAASFTLAPGAPASLAPGASATLGVTFAPSGVIGVREAVLTVGSGATTDTVRLYGLSANAEQGGNEPTLSDVLRTVGSPTTVGWTGLAGGTDPAPKGEEVEAELFQRVGTGPVSIVALASYAPFERLPYGWYAPPASGAPALRQVGALANGQQQTLLPAMEAGSATTFDPGTSTFGIYYTSAFFTRTGYTEDARNTGGTAHRARVYPARTRAGALVANAYVVAFEDADNGDYQDYVFLVSGVKPAGAPDPEPEPQPTSTIKVDFGTATSPLGTGYLRDHGQPYGPRTGTDQGGLTYGWLDPATEVPLNLAVGGTTPGNGRQRGVNPDTRYDTLMHMTPTDIAGTFNGTRADGYWELAVPSGSYRVTVAAGDASVNADPEQHTLVVEGTPAVTDFVPAGAAGSATRHATATVEVTVTDGRLTVAAGASGVNTKIDFVDVVPLSAPPATTTTQVDFTTATAPAQAGWLADTGQAFTTARGYGWLSEAGAPLDRTNATRERAATAAASSVDTTLNVMQGGVIAGVATGVWEYALPSGAWTVQVSVGDAGFADSSHSVDVEGERVISGFVPSAPGAYQVVTRTIAVTDGRLTVRPGANGTNTKIQWIRITGATGPDATPPSVDATVAGDTLPDGRFLDQATVTVAAGDAGGSGLASTTVAVDGGAAVPYTAPLVVTAPGAHTVVATATDGAGNTTTDTVTFTVVDIVATKGVLTSQNPEAAGLADRYVMSRTETDPQAQAPALADTAAVVLRNTGTEPVEVSGITVPGGGFAVEGAPALPVTVAPNATLSFTVRFTGTSGAAQTAVVERQLQVVSTASNGPVTRVELAGIAQDRPEGGTEPDVAEISRAYGFGTTILGPGQQLNNNGVLTRIGDEVLSPYWQRRDATKPVTVRQLAAYHSCCASTATFFTHAKGSTSTQSRLVHNGAWAQTVRPRINGSATNPALASFTPASTVFGFKIDPEWSDPALNSITVDQCPGQPRGVETATCELGHHLRIWPAEDRSGVAIPGAYLVVMDYSGINYDFNDNVYYVTNIVPEGQADTTPPPVPTGTTATRSGTSVTVSWAAVTAPDLAGYAVERSTGGAFTRLTGAPQAGTSYTDTAPAAGVTATYRVRAVDTVSNESAPSATASVTTPASAQPIRINAGGPAVTVGGVAWAADQYVSSSTTYSAPATLAIAGTDLDVLYLNERASTANGGSYTYSIPVPAGRYRVRLHFAEIYWGVPGGGAGGPGKRVFDVNIEGGAVEIDDLDLFATAGAATAVVREFTVDETDGTLQIQFAAGVNKPSLAALEVLPVAGTP